jgi:hypothetical protein
MIPFRRDNTAGAHHVCERGSGKEICGATEHRGTRATARVDPVGKSSAERLMKARILLKADVSEDGEGWSDSGIVEALDTSLTTSGERASNSWKRDLKRF